MTTECYAMVRGSAIRVTGLDRKGGIPDLIQYAMSKAVAKITINEVTDSGSDEMLGSEENDNDNRVRLRQNDEMVHYTVDIDFLRVDPGVLNLVAGVPLVYQTAGVGFGRGYFGESPFGGELAGSGSGTGFGTEAFGETPFGDTGEPGNPPMVLGFDSVTRRAPVSFGLEVWSKLAGNICLDGIRQYGYTVFPHLKGGYMTGFEFANGLVSFNIRGAQTRRAPKWAVGPYDLTGPHERLVAPVSRNTLYRQTLTVAPPPLDVCGIQETDDVIQGGTATVTSDDVIEGGTAASTSAWIVEGGTAA